MKDLSQITHTKGGYKLLTPIIVLSETPHGLVAIVNVVKNRLCCRINWDSSGLAIFKDGDDIPESDIVDYSIELESEYDILVKKLANCTEMVNGNKIANLVVLGEKYWTVDTVYHISGFYLNRDNIALHTCWTKEGYSLPCDKHNEFNLKL